MVHERRKVERAERDQDLRCQSGPSAKDSVHLQWRRLFPRIMGQTNNGCRFRISILTSSPTTSNLCLLEDKVQEPRYVLVHKFPTEAMQWIKEVEMVDFSG